jgi:tetratricopeptide (TPR) repeat protein
MLRPGVVAVVGESGLGKTVSCAAAINTVPVRRQHDRRRYWIDLEGVNDETEAEVKVAEQVGTETLDEAILSLGSSPSVLVIDHLEGFMGDDLAAADAFITRLGAVGGRSSIVLVAQGRPSWPESVRTVLEPPPLTVPEADQLFGLHAPSHATDERRFPLVESFGGLPRAIELVARTASLSDLPPLLAHLPLSEIKVGAGRTRETSLAVAVEVVLHAPIIGQEERRLLEELCLFPAGIAQNDFAVIWHSLPLAKLAAHRLYQAGLVRSFGAGVSVVPVVKRYIAETPDIADDFGSVQRRFVDLALERARSDDATNASWLAANSSNIDQACRDRWPGATELSIAVVERPDVGAATPAVADLAAEAGDKMLADRLSQLVGDNSAWLTARSLLVVAARIRRRLGDRLGEANALRYLGRLALRRDHLDDVADHLGKALVIYRDIDLRLGEAHTLKELGRLALRRDHLDDAADHLGKALVIYRDIDDRLGGANTLHDLGRLALKCENLDLAARRLATAEGIYGRIDMAAPWVYASQQALHLVQQRSNEAAEYLALARHSSAQDDVIRAINCLLDGGLPRRAAAVAKEFSLTIDHNGIIRRLP